MRAAATSHGEARASFGSACVDHCAARLGFHAHAKAVRALAARFRWLIGSLHFRSLGVAEKPGITARYGV